MSNLLRQKLETAGTKLIDTALTKTGAFIISAVLPSTALGFAFYTIRDWLRSDHLLPGYLLLVVPIIVFALTLLANRIRRSPSEERYRAEVSDQVIWRWEWANGSVIFRSINAYCPKCDTELLSQQANKPSRFPTYFECEHCGFRTPFYPKEDFSDLRQRVIRTMERHLRGNTWRDYTKRVRQAKSEAIDVNS